MFEKIYLIGNGRVADDCLKILRSHGIPFEFIEIFSEKFSFTEKLCERLEVPFSHVDKQDVKDFLFKIDSQTLIISAHNSYIFPKAVCEKENLTIINMHIALLPNYRGMNPSTWAIYNEEKYAGVTWHTVSSKIDNGGIIVQREVEIEPDDSAMKLMLKCFRHGVQLFDENIDSFVSGTFTTHVPANPDTRLYLSKDLPNHGYFDFEWGFDKAYAFLRSMDYSGANLMRLPRVVLEGNTYEIYKYVKEDNCESIDNKIFEINEDILKIKWSGHSLCCFLRRIVAL